MGSEIVKGAVGKPLFGTNDPNVNDEEEEKMARKENR